MAEYTSNEVIDGAPLSELDDLALMRKRFKAAEEAETLDRVSALEAIEFYFGHQWADEIERQRRADGRPCFTLNKLPAIVRQVLNEELQNPPSIEITPEGDGADDDTAEAQQGLAKHVETHSQAELAYGNAYQYLVLGGFASWRVSMTTCRAVSIRSSTFGRSGIRSLCIGIRPRSSLTSRTRNSASSCSR
jgi:hypothetical protein